MRKEDRPTTRASENWTNREAFLLAVICLLCGLALGYVAHGPSALAPPPAASSPDPPSDASAQQPTHPSFPPDMRAAPLLAGLKSDPKNPDLLAHLGNLYFDGRDYRRAIEYYQRALVERPNDVNVRTDMGTCYWYLQQPQEAVAEYRRSLTFDPTHPQTLYNLGVVLFDGLKDSDGAIAAWEKLLKTNPDYPGKSQVMSKIEEARIETSRHPLESPK